MGWGLRGGRIEQKRKRTHGHGQQYGDCWERGVKGDYMVIGKNTMKIKFKKCVLLIIMHLVQILCGKL